MDTMVLKTQQWLNATYGSDGRYNIVDEDGFTGWETIYGLTRALQIELGITAAADSFGPTTRSRFLSAYPNGVIQQAEGSQVEANIYAIIQGALWCKGYSTGASEITKHFYGGTGNAVKNLKSDMGISNSNSNVTVNVIAALLSMNQYTLRWSLGGTEEIRIIQQSLNASYEDYIGLIPCDGLYGRDMNKALIKVLQAVEGYTPSQATGNFGDGTKANIPILPDTANVLPASKEEAAIKLFRYALCCNGYSSGSVSGSWDSVIEQRLEEFQNDYVLPITCRADLNTWMSLLLSKGNSDRAALGCDCATILDSAKAQALYAAGYRYVGRYLSGTVGGTTSKAMTVNELNAIFAAGLKVFAIFQESTPSVSYFSYSQGRVDAIKAINAAKALGVPYRENIYFAVDYDIMDNQITSNVVPYFEGIRDSMNAASNFYRVGIYGPRHVCSRVSSKKLAISSFVSDMSTGFSGNMGYKIPGNWAFDQFHEYTFTYSGGSFGLDKDAYSERYSGFNNLIDYSGGNIPIPTEEIYRDRYEYLMSLVGIPVNISMDWDATYSITVGNVAIEFRGGHAVEYDRMDGYQYATIDVSDGHISSIDLSNTQSLYNQLDTGIQDMISSDGALTGISKFEQEIGNGKVEFGMCIDTMGNLGIHYLVKEVLWTDGTTGHRLYIELKFTVNKNPDNTSVLDQIADLMPDITMDQIVANARFLLNALSEAAEKATPYIIMVGMIILCLLLIVA